MRGTPRILVIGSSALAEAVTRAFPGSQSTTTETLLSGVWSVGHQQFDAVVVSWSAGHTALRAIRALREVAPQTRIIVTCTAAQEPRARAALQAGADDYILEPVAPDDLVAALDSSARPHSARGAGALPSAPEIMQLSEVLKNLGDGLQPTLERLAALVRRALGAQGVTIEVDDQAVTDGVPSAVVLEEPLHAPDRPLGRIALTARAGAAYTSVEAARLSEYARLTETIVAQIRAQAHWQELAWRDDLSELHNRRYLDATLDKLIARASAERLRLTVVLFDIDDFKAYNDRYGHDTGDALIREVAVLLTRCSREHDVVARYGGDEFAIVLWDAEPPRVPGSQHPKDAVALAERFRAVIENHAFQCLGPGAPGPVTLSGGLACFPWDGKVGAEIMKAADEALLAAKRSGKNRIQLAGSVTDEPKPESQAEA